MSLHTLHVPLKSSSALRVLSGLVHLGAGLALVWMSTTQPGWFPGLAFLGGHAWMLDRRLSGRAGSAWLRFRWTLDDRLHWECRDGRQGRGCCVEARTWGAVWVVLRFRPDGARLTQRLVIPRDATTPDAHRRLRVRARVAPPRLPGVDEPV